MEPWKEDVLALDSNVFCLGPEIVAALREKRTAVRPKEVRVPVGQTLHVEMDTNVTTANAFVTWESLVPFVETLRRVAGNLIML